MSLSLPQMPGEINEVRDHLRGRDRLVGIAPHGIFKRLAELPALYDVRALSDADLVVQQLPQRLQGQVLLLQCGHPT